MDASLGPGPGSRSWQCPNGQSHAIVNTYHRIVTRGLRRVCMRKCIRNHAHAAKRNMPRWQTRQRGRVARARCRCCPGSAKSSGASSVKHLKATRRCWWCCVTACVVRTLCAGVAQGQVRRRWWHRWRCTCLPGGPHHQGGGVGHTGARSHIIAITTAASPRFIHTPCACLECRILAVWWEVPGCNCMHERIPCKVK